MSHRVGFQKSKKRTKTKDDRIDANPNPSVILVPPTQLKPLGFYATAQQIVARETPLGLYKGLGAVASGIVPKMAIRFASFEGGCPWLFFLLSLLFLLGLPQQYP